MNILFWYSIEPFEHCCIRAILSHLCQDATVLRTVRWAKVGSGNTLREHGTGKHGLGDSNDNGERFMDIYMFTFACVLHFRLFPVQRRPHPAIIRFTGRIMLLVGRQMLWIIRIWILTSNEPLLQILFSRLLLRSSATSQRGVIRYDWLQNGGNGLIIEKGCWWI